VNRDDAARGPRFLCRVGDRIQGPFDLIELAGQLRFAAIDGETLVARKGEEDWLVFRDRAEFVAVQGIAAPLEEKTRVGRPTKLFAGIGPWTVGTIGLACAAGILALLSPAPAPAPAPNLVPSSPVVTGPAPWVETVGAHFTVRCPVRLWQVRSVNPEMVTSYRGFVLGAGFGVDTSSVTGNYSNVQDDHVVDSICGRFITGRQAHVTSDRVLDIPRRSGREVLFTTLEDSKTFVGGIRVIADGGTIISAWVTGLPTKFSPKDQGRFLESFEFK
jgi:hypothetical protein